jgi:hypothetical protein
MIFYRESHNNPFLSALSQAVLCRFYKEDVQGDTTAYVYSRGICTGKDPLEVLAEFVQEASDAHKWLNEIFSGEISLYPYFETFIRGNMYVNDYSVCIANLRTDNREFPAVYERYRLSEIGLGEVLEVR